MRQENKISNREEFMQKAIMNAQSVASALMSKRVKDLDSIPAEVLIAELSKLTNEVMYSYLQILNSVDLSTDLLQMKETLGSNIDVFEKDLKSIRENYGCY